MTAQFIHVFSMTLKDIIPILNPILIAIAFNAMFANKSYNKEQYKQVSWSLFFYSTLICIIILLLGKPLLLFFGISIAEVRVVGGILIFVSGWKMLSNDQPQDSSEDSLEHSIVYPLTVPLTIGGGAISTILTLSTYINENNFRFDLLEYAAAAIGLIVTCAMVAICCFYSSSIDKILGKSGALILTILFAFILLAMGMSHAVKGLGALFIVK